MVHLEKRINTLYETLKLNEIGLCALNDQIKGISKLDGFYKRNIDYSIKTMVQEIKRKL